MLLSRASSRRLRCYRASRAPERRAGVDAEPLAYPARHGRGGGRGRAGRRGGGGMARVRQGIDALQPLVDGAAQSERIQAGALTPQLRGHRGGNLRAGEHAVERRLWGVIAPADACPDPLLAEELDGGQEEILEEPEFAAVQGLDRGLRRRTVVAHVAQEL